MFDHSLFCEWANVFLFEFAFHFKPFDDNHWQQLIGNGILKLIQHCFDEYDVLKNKPKFVWIEEWMVHKYNIHNQIFHCLIS